MKINGMSQGERRIAISLAGIFSTRMLGLFMILPVFTLYAHELSDYTATLAGVALGIYGLTQALFQIPLGMLSDRIGRKPVIIGGLVVFALGSVVAASADTIYGVIAGRALQGAGAIASAVMALAADLTREEHRIKVMAFIGISIGMSFAAAMVLGPILHGWFGVPGIFWATAVLALAAMAIVRRVPRPVTSRFHRDTELEVSWFRHAIRDPQLLRVDAGILILHLTLMANFMVVPGILQNQIKLEASMHWLVYLPVLAFSILAIMPFIILAEKKHKIKQVLIFAVALLALVQLGFWQGADTLASVVFMLWLFFVAFNLLEASLPSLVAKLAPAAHKGTAMGVYTTSQFLGVFIGGYIGGSVIQHAGTQQVFLFNAVLLGVWLVLVMTMRRPKFYSSQLLNVGQMSEPEAEQLVERLSSVPGVMEAMVIAEDGVAYLKVDKQRLNQEALHACSVTQ